MLSNFIIGTKMPSITPGEYWPEINLEKGFAHGQMQLFDTSIDIFVKKGKNGSTTVAREIISPYGKKEILSLFDKNGKFVHYKILENGKMVEYAKTTLKKVVQYNLNKKTAITILKKLLFRK